MTSISTASTAMASDADKQQEGGDNTKETTRMTERPKRCMSAYSEFGSIMMRIVFVRVL